MTAGAMDLRAYSAADCEFRDRMRASSSPQAAADSPAAFLRDVERLFDGDVKRAYYQEVGYLWSVFPPRARTHAKYMDLLEVLLGQAAELSWYGAYPMYQTADDVRHDTSLWSFRRGAEDFDVAFSYVQYHGSILMRVPNSVRLRYRRWANHPGKYTQGLTTTRCKRAMAGLVNQISEGVAAVTDHRKPFRILVNSMLRTAEYQRALARIGYVAPRHSAHLAGYAVDLERLWYEENDEDVHQAALCILADLSERQVINLVEESTRWHICLNPEYIGLYEALSERWAMGQTL